MIAKVPCCLESVVATPLREAAGSVRAFAIRVAEVLVASDLTSMNGHLKVPFATACKQLFGETETVRWNNVGSWLRRLGILVGKGSSLRLKVSAITAASDALQTATTAPSRQSTGKKITAKIADPVQPTPSPQEILFRVMTTDDPVDAAFHYALDLQYRMGEKARQLVKELLKVYSPEDVRQILRVASQGIETYITLAARNTGM